METISESSKELEKRIYTAIFIVSLNSLIILGAIAIILVAHEQYFQASGLLLLSLFPAHSLANASSFFIVEWENSFRRWAAH